jgi:hypothetical protein
MLLFVILLLKGQLHQVLFNGFFVCSAETKYSFDVFGIVALKISFNMQVFLYNHPGNIFEPRAGLRKV